MHVMLRLQPIYSVTKRIIHGYEVLSGPLPAQDCETFFSSLSSASHQTLLVQQLNIIKQRNDYSRYYLNLPVALLSDMFAIEQLLPELHNNIIIELQDPENISRLSPSAARVLNHNLNLIRANDIPIWLDDIAPALFDDVSSLLFKFDGIKIDKYAFWTLSETPEHLRQFIYDCHTLTQNVTVEGIENIQQQRVATRCGANFLQGFLWPEIHIQHPYLFTYCYP